MMRARTNAITISTKIERPDRLRCRRSTETKNDAIENRIAGQTVEHETPTVKTTPVVVPAEIVTPAPLSAVVTATTISTTPEYRMDPQARRLRDFLKFQPTYFYGGGNPEKATGDRIVSHRRPHKEFRTRGEA
ncbi:hypothetical protein Sjap_008304 [Stephania japonica]|uniref:Uncharacterized protein n=1 Tax=Stephania japonica TaxID=461633 RepID=A0AAP0PEH0_9MAGN